MGESIQFSSDASLKFAKTGHTAGQSSPLGATIRDGGVNFSLFSRSATGVELLFFNHDDDPQPSRVIPLHPAINRTYHYWHVFVEGLQTGQIYGYRVQG